MVFTSMAGDFSNIFIIIQLKGLPCQPKASTKECKLKTTT